MKEIIKKLQYRENWPKIWPFCLNRVIRYSKKLRNNVKKHFNWFRNRVSKLLLVIKIRIREVFAEKAFLREDWAEAARRYEEICVQFGEKTPFRIYQRLFAAHKRLGDKTKAEESFKRTCSLEAREAQYGYDLLLKGKINESYKAFAGLMDKVFDDEQTRAIWQDSFRLMCGLFGDSKKPLKQEASENEITTDHQIYRKILVSGMAWSGSSALFDFFREFDDVFPVRGEFGHIQGSHGLMHLRKKRDDFKMFREELINFFGFGLLGFAEHYSGNTLKIARLCRTLSQSENGMIYAKGINNFCRIMETAYSGDTLDLDKFKRAVDILLDTVAKTQGAQNHSYVLFDNIIKIYNLPEFAYISNASIFCAFRDPRSNYVDRKGKDRKFTRSVVEFIRRYRKVRFNVQKSFDSIEHNKSNVHFVQFEDFVQSEDYRNELARRIGLDPDKGHDRHKYFKPWESEKNVCLYETYEKQDEIRLIEKELPEYCLGEASATGEHHRRMRVVDL